MTTWIRHPRVLWRRSGQRRVVLPPGSDEVLVLAGRGVVVWDLLSRPMSEPALVATMSDAAHLERGEAAAELVPFLEDLHRDGVLRRA